ncbi:MAG: efflux RND transporter periplasmic adaptor subunit [Terriglobales bacterium]
MSNRVCWGLFSALALLGLLSLAGCSHPAEANGGAAAAAGPAAFPVKVQVAQPQRVGESTEYLATLRSRDAAVLQPQVEGQVTRIFVRSGQVVEAGTPLLQIDPLKQQATVNNQEAARRARLANLDWSRKELERRKQLFAAGVISRQELDQAQSAYDAAVADVDALEAGVREQQVQLHYYTVKAPAGGVIGDIPVRVGDRVKVDTVLTTLDSHGGLEAYISIPAEKAADVRPGTVVEILDDQDKPVVRSAISFISPRVDPATQLLLVKAPAPNGNRRFRNEQVVHVRVVWQQVERPLVPVTAVSRVSGQTFVFVAEKSGDKLVARQRAVRLGDIVGNEYVVLDGVKPGEQVVTTGVQVLADGMPVKPQS